MPWRSVWSGIALAGLRPPIGFNQPLCIEPRRSVISHPKPRQTGAGRECDYGAPHTLPTCALSSCTVKLFFIKRTKLSRHRNLVPPKKQHPDRKPSCALDPLHIRR
jgi:hypothetical protein